MLRVGLIADTHGLLRPEATALPAGSDHIVHAGDVGDPAILDTLAAIAPVTAIRGNVDTDRVGGPASRDGADPLGEIAALRRPRPGGARHRPTRDGVRVVVCTATRTSRSSSSATACST